MSTTHKIILRVSPMQQRAPYGYAICTCGHRTYTGYGEAVATVCERA